MDKKQQFELERHINILSAPNYNLPIIFKDVLNGFKQEKTVITDFNQLLNNSRTHSPDNSNISKHKRNNSSLSHITPDKVKTDKVEVDYKRLVTEGPKKLSDYRLGSVLLNIRKNNYNKIIKTLLVENSNLNNNISSITKDIDKLNSKCTLAISEKIEYIDETNQIEQELNEALKEKLSLSESKQANENTNISPSQTLSTREVTNKQLNLTDSKTNDKQKKIQELRKYYKGLKDQIETIKLKVKEKEVKENNLKIENKELKELIKQHYQKINQLKLDIDHMKKYVNIKEKSTPVKILGAFKSIFKK